MLVAGGEEGNVRVFNVESKTMLRVMKGKDMPVRVARFSPGGTQVMSGSDDGVVRAWDLQTGDELSSLIGHQDSIRTGEAYTDDVWVTGSYDHTVKLWDVRSSECINSLDHGAPVESVVVYANGGIVVSSGGSLSMVLFFVDFS